MTGHVTRLSGAIGLLDAYAPSDSGQRAARAEFIAFASTVPEPMARSTFPEHLTASCLVISADGQQVLLHFHRKASRWLQFGGHIDDGDGSLPAAALREVTEESGLAAASVALVPAIANLDRHELGPGFRCGTAHWDVQFAAIADPSAPLVRADSESADLRWFDRSALPEVDDAVRRQLIAARQLASSLAAKRLT